MSSSKIINPGACKYRTQNKKVHHDFHLQRFHVIDPFYLGPKRKCSFQTVPIKTGNAFFGNFVKVTLIIIYGQCFRMSMILWEQRRMQRAKRIDPNMSLFFSYCPIMHFRGSRVPHTYRILYWRKAKTLNHLSHASIIAVLENEHIFLIHALAYLVITKKLRTKYNI